MAMVCFASDLHLFARRSTAPRYHADLIRIARECDVCVLGGDIFDFRWSIHGSEEATANAAIEWLREFDEQTQNCRVHFLLGNHDDHPLLHQRLPQLMAERETFEWSRFFYRLGNTLFLHGDVADRTMTAACLEASRNAYQHRPPTPLQHRLYDMVVKAHLHRVAPTAVYPRKKVALRILSYMEHIGHSHSAGVEHVCFGHTHRPVNNYCCKQVTFHNGGAPIGKGAFRIVIREVDLTATAQTEAVRIDG